MPAIKQLDQSLCLLSVLCTDSIASAKVSYEDQCRDLLENDSALHCCLARFLHFLRWSPETDSETDETFWRHAKGGADRPTPSSSREARHGEAVKRRNGLNVVVANSRIDRVLAPPPPLRRQPARRG